MERFTGVIGILVLLALAYLMSNNRKSINYRQVLSGLLIQVIVAVFILKVPIGQQIFQKLGYMITRLLDFSNEGANFVFGLLVDSKKLEGVFGPGSSFIFILKILPIILV